MPSLSQTVIVDSMLINGKLHQNAIPAQLLLPEKRAGDKFQQIDYHARLVRHARA